ncbi:unnamed protein product [Brachionus calyciflorus]|uniref:Peptidase S1 domain-containing protein n=1 Tax=Brachionus calyciflorus TaxID=104777 RepID=A0A813VFE5_9BILA|nr:unnamed protein product [Brachionus calyciflorus]
MSSENANTNTSLLKKSRKSTNNKPKKLIITSLICLSLTTFIILYIFLSKYLKKTILIDEPKFQWSHCGQTHYKPNVDLSKFDTSIRHKRIIGGEDSVKNSWPFLVSIRLVNNQSYHVCGGNLISDSHVLTAAHCLWLFFRPLDFNLTRVLETIEVYVGIHELNTDPQLLGDEYKYKIEIFNWHPDFDSDNLSLFNDIAIIKLKRKVNLNRPEANLVCLPFGKNYELKVDDWVVAIGWGTYSEDFDHSEHHKNYPQQAFFKIQDQHNSYCNSGLIGENWDKSRTVCAYDETQTPKSTCFGDSGGPVVAYRDHKWFLFGVISFGNDESNSTMRRCNGSQPFYFMNVTAYSDWILETIEKLK